MGTAQPPAVSPVVQRVRLLKGRLLVAAATLCMSRIFEKFTPMCRLIGTGSGMHPHSSALQRHCQHVFNGCAEIRQECKFCGGVLQMPKTTSSWLCAVIIIDVWSWRDYTYQDMQIRQDPLKTL